MRPWPSLYVPLNNLIMSTHQRIENKFQVKRRRIPPPTSPTKKRTKKPQLKNVSQKQRAQLFGDFSKVKKF